jgi:hypothetical protein
VNAHLLHSGVVGALTPGEQYNDTKRAEEHPCTFSGKRFHHVMILLCLQKMVVMFEYYSNRFTSPLDHQIE